MDSLLRVLWWDYRVELAEFKFPLRLPSVRESTGARPGASLRSTAHDTASVR